MIIDENDLCCMKMALQEAKNGEAKGEVPVGAVLVSADNQLLASAHNSPIGAHDPCAHAEMRVLREGALKLKNYRLLNTTLYVTLEPCLMCAAALVHARVGRVVFGAYDPKAGALASQLDIFNIAPWLNHRYEVTGGVLAQESGALLTQFFQRRRGVLK